MSSIFRKLTGRRKKSKPTTESSHTAELDASKAANRPQHINEKSETTSTGTSTGRSRSNDRSKRNMNINSGTAPENPITGATTQISGEEKPRTSRFSYTKHHAAAPAVHAAVQPSGAATYDSEDETAATTSTATAPLKRGRKPRIQQDIRRPNPFSPQTRVLRIVNRSKQVIGEHAPDRTTTTATSTPESAPSTSIPSLLNPVGKVPPDSSPEDIAKQIAQNKETERIARAAAALDNRGNEYFERGYYDKAMDAYTRALKLKRRTFHSMLEEADEIFDEAVENEKIDRDDRDLDPKLLVSMATSINNIGYLRQRAGEATPDETMAAYKKSLRIKRKILGNDSLSVGKTLNNIGSVYYLKKEFEGALPAYEEALAIMQANLGEDHPDVATVISNMGDVWLAMKNNDESLARYRTALNIRWCVFGEKDPRTVRLLEKIARIEIGDKMPTPRGITLMDRQVYDWDESELYDLDLRPISHELRLLKDQVKEDLATVDLLEKKIAMGMVRDKLRIVRGMRELSEAQERGNASFGALEGSFNWDDSTRSVDDVLLSQQMPPEVADIYNYSDELAESRSELQTESRSDAQARVKERLKKLRLDKGLPVDGPVLSSSFPVTTSITANQKNESAPKSDPEPSRFLRSALYSTCQQTNRTSLSSLKPSEIKEQANDVESALKLKKGIDNLRASGAPMEKTLRKLYEKQVENLPNVPEGEVENPVDEAPDYKVDCPLKDAAQNPGDELAEKVCGHTTVERTEEVDNPKDKLVAPKLIHATWLGEIEG